MPGRRVILHAGFHKTGTTSAQRFLLANGKNIWPRRAMVLPGKIRKTASRMAVRYSVQGKTALLDAFAEDLQTALRAIDPGEKRAILISDENLAGRMPGRDGQLGYTATPSLMARAEDVICGVFGAEADVVFHFTTRHPETWLRSTYKHNMRASRLTLDWGDYAAKFAFASDLLSVTEDVASAVTGTVFSAALEALDGPFGPAAPLIDLMELPPHLRKNLMPQPPQNPSPRDEHLPKLLELNRSDLSDDAVMDAKRQLLAKDVE